MRRKFQILSWMCLFFASWKTDPLHFIWNSSEPSAQMKSEQKIAMMCSRRLDIFKWENGKIMKPAKLQRNPWEMLLLRRFMTPGRARGVALVGERLTPPSTDPCFFRKQALVRWDQIMDKASGINHQSMKCITGLLLKNESLIGNVGILCAVILWV